MVPLSFVMLTVRIVDFILRLDFTDILKVADPTRKKEPSGFGQHASFALLFSYLFGVDI